MFKNYLRKYSLLRKSNTSSTSNAAQPIIPVESNEKKEEVSPFVIVDNDNSNDNADNNNNNNNNNSSDTVFATVPPENVENRESEVNTSPLEFTNKGISSLQQQPQQPHDISMRRVDVYEHTVITTSDDRSESDNNNNNNDDDFMFEEEQKHPLSTLRTPSSGIDITFSGNDDNKHDNKGTTNNININNNINYNSCGSISSSSNSKMSLSGSKDVNMSFGLQGCVGLVHLPTHSTKTQDAVTLSPHSIRHNPLSDKSPSTLFQEDEEEKEKEKVDEQEREKEENNYSVPFTQKISVAPPNERLLFVYYDDDDTEVTGSTLDEPMTPHSFSSIMRNSELKKWNNNYSSNPVHNSHNNHNNNNRNNKLFGGFGNSLYLSSRDQKTGSVMGSSSLSLNFSSPTSSRHRAETDLQQSESMPVERNSHYCENGKPPFPALSSNTIEVMHRNDFSATHNMSSECKEMESPTEIRRRDSSRLWQFSSLPPEPKELRNVNVGRPRSASLKSHVLESSSVDKHPVGNYQKLLNDKYVIYSKWNLGVGSYSKVLLCYNLEDEVYYAVKVLDRVRLQRKGLGVDCALHKVRREIAIMKKLRHRNIIKLVEVIDDPRSRKIYLVLELAEHGEIMSLRDDGTVIPIDNSTTLAEEEVVRVMRSIVSAAMYAHHLGIAHRDIKPQNILLTAEGDVKLSDFGVSIIVDDSSAPVRREGSVAFLPPEMLVSSEVQIVSSVDCRLHTMGCRNNTHNKHNDNNNNINSTNNNSNNNALCSPISVTTATKTTATKTTAVTGSTMETTPNYHVMHACRSCNSMCKCAGETQEEAVHPASAPVFAQTWTTTTTHPLTSYNNNNNCYNNNNNTSIPAPQVDLFKADVFSLGVTAFVLLLGRLPWRAHDVRSQLNAILSESDPFKTEFEKAYDERMMMMTMMNNNNNNKESLKEQEQEKGKKASDNNNNNNNNNRFCSPLCEEVSPNLESKPEECLLNCNNISELPKCGIVPTQDANENVMSNTQLHKSSISSITQINKDKIHIGNSETEQVLKKPTPVFQSFPNTRDVSQSTWESEALQNRINSINEGSNSSMTTTAGLTPIGSSQTRCSQRTQFSIKSSDFPTAAPMLFVNLPRDRHLSSTQIDSILNASRCSSLSPKLPKSLKQGSHNLESGYIRYEDVVLEEESSLQERDGMILSSVSPQCPTNTVVTDVNSITVEPFGMKKVFPSSYFSSSGEQPITTTNTNTTNTNTFMDNEIDPVSTVVQDDEEMTENKLNYLPATEMRGEISANAIDFIRCCLKVDPSERSTMSDLYKHPWIQELIESEKQANLSLSPIFSRSGTFCVPVEEENNNNNNNNNNNTNNEEHYGITREKESISNTDVTLIQGTKEELTTDVSGEKAITKLVCSDEIKETSLVYTMNKNDKITSTSNNNNNNNNIIMDDEPELQYLGGGGALESTDIHISANSSMFTAEGLYNPFVHPLPETIASPLQTISRHCETNYPGSTCTITVSALTSPLNSFIEHGKTELSPARLRQSQPNNSSNNNNNDNNNNNNHHHYSNENNNNNNNSGDRKDNSFISSCSSNTNMNMNMNHESPTANSYTNNNYDNQTNNTLLADMASAVTHATAGPRRLRGYEEIAVPCYLAARLRDRHSLRHICDDSCMTSRALTTVSSQTFSSGEDISACSRNAGINKRMEYERHMDLYNNNNNNNNDNEREKRKKIYKNVLLHHHHHHHHDYCSDKKNKSDCLGDMGCNLISSAVKGKVCSKECSDVVESGCTFLIQASSESCSSEFMQGIEEQQNQHFKHNPNQHYYYYHHRRTFSYPN